MQTHSEIPSLDEIYHNLKPLLEIMEKLRKKEREKYQIFMGMVKGGAGAAGVGIVLKLANFTYPTVISVIIGLGILTLLISLWLSMKLKSDYDKVFKDKIVGGVVRAVNPDFLYDAERYLTKTTFIKTQLFSRQKINYYEGEDLVKGKWGNTDFSFSEVHVEQKVDKNRKTIFNGLFMLADFHKSFQGRTMVIPTDKAPVILKMLSRFAAVGAERITLEDPEFENVFAVYSTDEIEARYILSPSMMSDLKEIWKRFRCNVYVSFYQEDMSLLIDWGRDMFQTHWEAEATDKGLISLFYDELMLCLKLIDDLNLNTRIWSKRP